MAYNLNDLTKLNALKLLGERIANDFATKQSVSTLGTRVESLIAAGGEPNTIDAVKVNGVAQEIVDKTVNLTIPTKVSDLTNDSKYQTETEVAATVATAVADVDHLKRTKVDSVDAIDLTAADADQYIYMVPRTDNKSGNKYDEYMILDGDLEKVGDWGVELSGYVQKEDGKGLSTNDFTDADKEKLDSIAEDATKVEASTIPGNIVINGTEVSIVKIAEDSAVGEMLDDVFGATS